MQFSPETLISPKRIFYKVMYIRYSMEKKMGNSTVIRNNYNKYASVLLLLLMYVTSIYCGDRLIIQLKDFTKIEVKAGGFNIPADTRVHIYALGGGVSGASHSNSDLYAYGWIINADSRELIWKMDRNNTSHEKNFSKFDNTILLPKGSYEVYFAAYGFESSSTLTNFSFNIDQRRQDIENKSKNKGFFNWLEELFKGDYRKEWYSSAKNWEISVYVDEGSGGISTFNPPKEFLNVVFKATKLGEDERIKQRFKLNSPMLLHIYALGEKDFSDGLADYGWIINLQNHKRIWEMRRGNIQDAGGDEKNVKFYGIVNLPAGEFALYYNTDDSHSNTDWNAAPPYDPFNYGVTLIAASEKEKSEFKLISSTFEEQNVIIQLIKVGNDETRSGSFTLKEESSIRVYAIGEQSDSYRRMADYGWIIDAKSRDKVWTMDIERTEPAGGTDKNRMIDEVIKLPKGTYTVFYQTDDSHAYDDWNDSPPADPEHWGITIYGEGEHFRMNNVEKNIAAPQTNVLAQIIQVGNSADRTQSFSLSKTTHIKIYSLGEGQNREMYDYGWIENAKTHGIVWEMTYSMSFHAGGGRKNRMVSTSIILDAGSYILHYVTDDSHSFNRWNTDPPDDPTMWGITLYQENK